MRILFSFAIAFISLSAGPARAEQAIAASSSYDDEVVSGFEEAFDRKADTAAEEVTPLAKGDTYDPKQTNSDSDKLIENMYQRKYGDEKVPVVPVVHQKIVRQEPKE